MLEEERDGINSDDNWNLFRETIAEKLFFTVALPRLKSEVEE